MVIMSHVETALAYLQAGLSVVATGLDKKPARAVGRLEAEKRKRNAAAWERLTPETRKILLRILNR